MHQFTFIDLFAGIGGTRIAFTRAGGQFVFSSEIDKFAQKAYFENFGESPAGDILTISARYTRINGKAWEKVTIMR